MFPKVERLSAEFALLTSQEKVEFLRRVTPLADGEWKIVDGEVHFTPSPDEIWTLDAEEAWFELLK